MRHSHSIVGGTLLTGSLTSHAAEVGGRITTSAPLQRLVDAAFVPTTAIKSPSPESVEPVVATGRVYCAVSHGCNARYLARAATSAFTHRKRA